MSFEDGLIHSCTIIKKAQTSQDGYGAPIYTNTSNNSACRFYNSKGSIISPASGEHAVNSPTVMLPSSATVDEGYFVATTVTGFTGTYRVKHVNPIPRLFSNAVHHYECELEAVE